MKFNLILFMWICVVTLGCQSQNKEKKNNSVQQETPSNALIKSIQKAHKLKRFNQEAIVSFDIQLLFNGNDRLNATIYASTDSKNVHVKKDNGVSLLFDGKDVWINPADSLYEAARFDALTWSYFFMAPFKLNDPGTKHSEIKVLPYQNDKKYQAVKLTFGEDIGDAPDDWYYVYQNPETNYLEAMAYIVTFGGREQDKAAQNPHAITYSDYTIVNEIAFAQLWRFWNWSMEDGIKNQLGTANISNIKFSDNYAVFDIPKKAEKVAL